MKAIDSAIQGDPSRLAAMVVGAGTYGAFAALDRLIGAGVATDRLFVHLGFTQPRSGHNKFVKYHPMLHSKVYYTDQPGGMGPGCLVITPDKVA